jgi:biotin carboxylase
MNSWFIAVTAGRWQICGIKRLQELGYSVVAIDSDPKAEGLAIAEKAICRKLDDTLAILDELEELRTSICGVTSFVSDAGMNLAAVIRERFTLPGPSVKTSQMLTNKKLQRQAWRAAKVPSPEFKAFKTSREAIEYSRLQQETFVIKPTDSSGSRGVIITDRNDKQLEEFVRAAIGLSKSGEVIVESYMDGAEFTVESVIANGRHNVLAITKKKKNGPEKCSVSRELATTECSSDIRNRIASAVAQAYDALGYTNGLGHAEVILSENGDIGLVEVAGRGGGFLVYEKLVPAVSGVDIIDLTIDLAVGKEIGELFVEPQHGVLRFIPSREGVLRSVEGIDQANLLDGVEAGMIAKEGDHMREAETDADRVAWILATGSSAEEAQIRANIAESLISVSIL